MRVLAARPLRLILLRHGEKAYAPGPESERPLSTAAEGATATLAHKLLREHLAPDVILSSRWRHAMQTAEIIGGICGAPVIPATGLTPFTDEDAFTPRAIFREARASRVVPADLRSVLLVGHHDRVSTLAGTLCRIEPLREYERLEGAILEAASLRALLSCRSVFLDFVRA
jgi:phosphohistidine phosphatase SixA